MFKGDFESLSCWCIIFVEKVQFVNQIPYPIFLRISRVKHYGPITKKTKNFESDFSVTDSNHVAQFDCEFSIPITIFQKDGVVNPKILDVEIVASSGKKSNDVISMMRMDVANLKDPRSKERQISKFDSKYGTAEMTFRLVVIPCSEMEEKPFCYFGFISLRSVQPVVEDVALTVSEFSEVEDLAPPDEEGVADGKGGLIVFENSTHDVNIERNAGEMQERPKNGLTLAMFMKNVNGNENQKKKERKEREERQRAEAEANGTSAKPKKASNSLKDLIRRSKQHSYPSIEQSKETDTTPTTNVETPKKTATTEVEETKKPKEGIIGNGLNKKGSMRFLFQSYTTQLFDTLIPQLNTLSDINMQQCKAAFAQVVFQEITIPENREEDHSAKLMGVLLLYNLNNNPCLTPDKLYDVISPLFRATKDVLAQNMDLTPRFGIFATIINFGIIFSNNFCEKTSATSKVLDELSIIITQTIDYFNNYLMSLIVSSMMGDGFEALDKEQLTLLTQSIRAFTQLGKRFRIPDVIVQAIVVECCSQFDSLMYNIIIDTPEIYTEDDINTLTEHIRDIQASFECLSSNFTIAFPHLLEFITTTKQLFGSIDPKRIKPSKTLRSILDRCQPAPSLPEGMTKDSFGETTDSRSSLRVPKPTQKYIFSFEKLFLDSATGVFD